MYILDLIGTFAFAIAGAHKAVVEKLNVWGILLAALATGIGGGTLRDMMLGRLPSVYLHDPWYFYVVFAGSIIVMISPAFSEKGYSFFRFLDSIGLAAFAVIGTSIAEQHLFPNASGPTVISFLSTVFFGGLTGFGGGAIRDIMLGSTPSSFSTKSNYAMSAFIGSGVFYCLMFTEPVIATILSLATTIGLREIISPYGSLKMWLQRRKKQGAK